jgi:hypothetical protein
MKAIMASLLLLTGCSNDASLNSLPINHTVEQVTVNNAHAWYSGEYRHCFTAPPSNSTLTCVVDTSHKEGTEVIDVVYDGSVDTQKTQEWECKRTNEGITCKQSQPKILYGTDNATGCRVKSLADANGNATTWEWDGPCREKQ